MTTQFHDKPLSAAALDQLFHQARSYNGWLDRPVSEDQIHAIYDLLKMGPTSANMQPARLVWVRSDAAKAKLAACVSEGNRAKVEAAPVTVLVGMDSEFHQELPWLFPHTDAKSWFAGDADARKQHAFRNSALQGGYLMLAARALGLDCGPMSGFDAAAVNSAFFADQPNVTVNFICSLGYGDPGSIFGRSPRPDFGKFNHIV